MNILYSATKQWNIGDEAILYGCQNILTAVVGTHNKILYNRNPQIRTDAPESDRNQFFYDNSFKYDTPPQLIDACCMAGSPENFSRRCEQFFDVCENVLSRGGKCYFMGLNDHETDNITERKIHLMEKSEIVSVRSACFLESYRKHIRNVVYLPCPALLCMTHEASAHDKRCIGIVVNGPEKLVAKCHDMPMDVFNYFLAVIQKILAAFKEYRIRFIAHYIDELNVIDTLFGKKYPVDYSHDFRDYESFYAACDCVISSRIHGCGIASSLGIPNMGLGYDFRADTLNGFKTYMIAPGSDIRNIPDAVHEMLLDRKNFRQKMIEYKKTVLNEYVQEILSAPVRLQWETFFSGRYSMKAIFPDMNWFERIAKAVDRERNLS